jgi:hypothetical protein
MAVHNRPNTKPKGVKWSDRLLHQNIPLQLLSYFKTILGNKIGHHKIDTHNFYNYFTKSNPRPTKKKNLLSLPSYKFNLTNILCLDNQIFFYFFLTRAYQDIFPKKLTYLNQIQQQNNVLLYRHMIWFMVCITLGNVPIEIEKQIHDNEL